MGSSQIDIKSDAFARRLANLLTDRREATGATVRDLARASGPAFNTKFLRAVEEGRAELDEQTVCELAALYGAELAEILPSRMPLQIQDPGIISTSGIKTEFDPRDRDSLLTSYLLLIRQLRAQEREPIIDLRREDVETLATFLHEEGTSVLDRLSTLMGATRLQRRAMVGMFVAGAIVVGLAGSGVAAFNGTIGDPSVSPVLPDRTAAATTVEAADGLVPLAADPTDATITVNAQPAQGPGLTPVPRELREPALATPVTPPPPATIIVFVEDTSVVDTTPVEATETTPPATAPGQVATGNPPVVTESSVAVGDAPVVTAPELTIPDVPYDLPTTTPPVTTQPPVTTPSTTPPATDAPPPVTTEAEVATGSPPLPPP